MANPKRQKISKYNTSASLGECSGLSKAVNNEQSTYSSGRSYNLALLPSEVIMGVYSYLTPVDLVTMTEVGNKRLKDLTFYIEHADFSSCFKANPQRISEFFSRRRVKDIKKINFNYVTSFKPHIITNFICRCKNLTVLSIVECGLSYKNLSRILVNCPGLEKLFWTLDEKEMVDEAVTHSKIKYVYLFCGKFSMKYGSVCFFLYSLVNVQSMWIHCSSDAISALPFHGVWLRASSVVNSTLTRRYTFVTSSFQISFHKRLARVLSKIVNEGSDEVPLQELFFEATNEPPDSKTFAFGPYVQIKSNVEDVLTLLQKPCNTFSTVSIILTPEILDVSENLAKGVSQAASTKLRQLSLQSEAYHFTDEKTEPMPISSEESLTICDVLDKCANTCKYITDLNLITVHFTIGSPFKAISKLKFLKTLHLPSCAFFKSYNKVLEKNLLDSEPMRFDVVVASCVLVETFSLFCCRDDYGQLLDNDLYAIKDWHELKCLNIYSIVVRTCYFLRRVAECCKKLQSLSLVAISPNNMCIYTPDLIYVLKNAKNLSFIRINEENFNPMYERFWDAMGEAINLEGICIMTNLGTYIDKPKVVASVKKLKYLKLFHFFAPRTTERLFSEIKRTMQSNGVCVLNIEPSCYCNQNYKNARLEYYHNEPHFCCQHVHFRDFVNFSEQNV